MGQSSVVQEVLHSLFYRVVNLWIGFLIVASKFVRAWSSYKEQHVFWSEAGPRRAKKNVIVIACLQKAFLISSIAEQTQHGSLLLNTAGLFFLTMMFFLKPCSASLPLSVSLPKECLFHHQGLYGKRAGCFGGYKRRGGEQGRQEEGWNERGKRVKETRARKISR